MILGGFIKNSFVDYPSNIAAVIFTAGCNMNCWYCHNQNLITTPKKLNNQKKLYNEIFDFLKFRQGQIDGVVITGGEPTLHSDLYEFISEIKKLNFNVKLDTNGTNPDVLARLLDAKLIDYIAMDIKAPLSEYKSITQTNNDIEKIKQSISLIISSDIDYEFRTTFAPPLTTTSLVEIAKYINSAKNYYIQKYKPANINSSGIIVMPISSSEMINAQKMCGEYVKNCKIRGI